MRLPDFVIIGQQRCGTTSLYATLAEHPGIGTSKRGALDEIHFFVNKRRYKRGVEWYKKQFEGDEMVIGEKSPMYLQHYLAPRRMKKVNPAVKLIVMLRNPIDRALSNYHKAKAKGFVSRSFEDVILLDEPTDEPTQSDWLDFWGGGYHLRGFLERGYYAKHIRRWYEFFPRRSMLIIRSEDFYTEPQAVIQNTLDFLGVERIDLQVVHLQKLRYADMAQETREKLAEYFEPKNKELYELIGRDMGW